MMARADKAVLRLAVGQGLCVLMAYGLGMKAPFFACVMSAFVLCRPGAPIPFLKGVVLALVIAALLGAGVLMVPLLENYAFTGVLFTGAVLYVLFRAGAAGANPVVVTLSALAVTVIPVAGVAEQAFALQVSQSLAMGLAVGVLVAGLSHALFPDSPQATAALAAAQAPVRPDAETASWKALRATVAVLPVFMVALTNPALYIVAVVKTVALSQQASAMHARAAGKELVGSTFMGAVMAVVVWMGLSMLPNLWMLTLWISAAALWAGVRLFRIKASSFPPSFWVNALVTMWVLLGPAIEDGDSGKAVYLASAIRLSVLIAVSLYAWAVVWALESWREAKTRKATVHG